MAFYSDLSEYSYRESRFYRPGTKNVGWLDLGHDFARSEPLDETLSKIWAFCKVAVAQTRGLHECEFCPEDSNYAERNGEKLLLGRLGDTRVFGRRNYIRRAQSYLSLYEVPQL